MERKKLMILVDWFYPGYKAGGPIQSCRNLVNVLENDFDIYIFTSDRDLGDINAYPGIITDTWMRFSERARVYYSSKDNVTFSSINRMIHEISPHFVYLNSMFSLKFTLFPIVVCSLNKCIYKMIIAPRGMLHEGAMKFKPFKKKLLVKTFSFLGIPNKIKFHATDEQEKVDILSYFPSAKSVSVLVNFPKMYFGPINLIEKKINEVKMVYISRISPKKNLLFLLDILKDIGIDNKIELNICGSIEDEDYWHECSMLIVKLPDNVAVKYVGAIDNDTVIAYIQRHHIFILPSFGENFGHSIFESFAAGRPVLISDKTPWRNLLNQSAGWDISLDEPSKFISCIKEISGMGQNEYEQLCLGSRQYYLDRIDEKKLKDNYIELFS